MPPNPSPSRVTHEDLRKAAVRWLTNNQKCSVVLSEIVTAAGEIPDAIGWKYGHSYLVECKASRSDFHANGNKCHSRSGSGMGQRRFFLCPPEIIRSDDLLESDYGLLWLKESGRIQLVREALPRETDATHEIRMLTWIVFQLVLTALLMQNLEINCEVREANKDRMYVKVLQTVMSFLAPLPIIVVDPIVDRYCKERAVR